MTGNMNELKNQIDQLLQRDEDQDCCIRKAEMSIESFMDKIRLIEDDIEESQLKLVKLEKSVSETKNQKQQVVVEKKND